MANFVIQNWTPHWKSLSFYRVATETFLANTLFPSGSGHPLGHPLCLFGRPKLKMGVQKTP